MLLAELSDERHWTKLYYCAFRDVSIPDIFSATTNMKPLNKFSTALKSYYKCTAGASFMIGEANITMTKLKLNAFLDSAAPTPDFTKAGKLT